jgi:signal transduction histidine kinase
LVNQKIIDLKYLFLHVSILILIATLPLHFYISSELEKSSLQDKISLQGYAQKVANKIYKFSNSSEREFFFPRSNIYQAGIYDKDEKEIFSFLDDSTLPSFTQNIVEDDELIYLRFQLKENVFGAKYLVVAKKISYLPIILNVLLILIIIVILLFIATVFILKQSTEPYKKFNQYLENFIKDAMHEMKTPLGVILLNLDGLDETLEKNKMIKRAKSALKNMIVVYEDLEFFVRKNVVEHPKEHLNLSLFCKERIDFFKDLLEAKEIKVTQNIEDEIFVDFSRLELSRIIDNTLSNAIKYSKNQTIITINLYKKDRQIYLQICDEGKGIKEKEKIFERYYRGDKISGGFGIGLSIVKNICDKNGVKIELESTLKKGSSFTFVF